MASGLNLADGLSIAAIPFISNFHYKFASLFPHYSRLMRMNAATFCGRRHPAATGRSNRDSLRSHIVVALHGNGVGLDARAFKLRPLTSSFSF